MSSCCNKTHITSALRQIEVDYHRFLVNIVYCNSCGSLKSTTSIREVKDDDKTKH